jgi:hypothetical protein
MPEDVHAVQRDGLDVSEIEVDERTCRVGILGVQTEVAYDLRHDVSALLGIPRSTDGGVTWYPTLAVDDDVHQVLAHPTRPEIVVAAASVGLCRSLDGGATWTSSTEGMDLTYARGVAFVDDDVVITVSEGPWASRALVYRASVEGGGAEAVGGGLGELHGNVDSRCIASDGKIVALADGDGAVWRSSAGCEGFERIIDGLDGVTGVTVA